MACRIAPQVKAYGVVGPIPGILESFLQERSLKDALNGQTSPLYITNAGVPRGSDLGPALFLVFINDLPDEVLSKIGMAPLSIPVLVSLNVFVKVKSAGELELDLRSIVEWGDKWLVIFNATKTKLLSSNRHRFLWICQKRLVFVCLP